MQATATCTSTSSATILRPCTGTTPSPKGGLRGDSHVVKKRMSSQDQKYNSVQDLRMVVFFMVRLSRHCSPLEDEGWSASIRCCSGNARLHLERVRGSNAHIWCKRSQRCSSLSRVASMVASEAFSVTAFRGRKGSLGQCLASCWYVASFRCQMLTRHRKLNVNLMQIVEAPPVHSTSTLIFSVFLFVCLLLHCLLCKIFCYHT